MDRARPADAKGGREAQPWHPPSRWAAASGTRQGLRGQWIPLHSPEEGPDGLQGKASPMSPCVDPAQSPAGWYTLRPKSSPGLEPPGLLLAQYLVAAPKASVAPAGGSLLRRPGLPSHLRGNSSASTKGSGHQVHSTMSYRTLLPATWPLLTPTSRLSVIQQTSAEHLPWASHGSVGSGAPFCREEPQDPGR